MSQCCVPSGPRCTAKCRVDGVRRGGGGAAAGGQGHGGAGDSQGEDAGAGRRDGSWARCDSAASRGYLLVTTTRRLANGYGGAPRARRSARRRPIRFAGARRRFRAGRRARPRRRELAARMLREGLTTHHKTSISDVVSAADHAAEKLVVDRLRAERPDDAIVGEEGTDDAGAGRTWFVDPVDGTYNFLSGLPAWCAAVRWTSARRGLPAGDGRAVARRRRSSDDPQRRRHCRRCTTAPLAEVSIATYLHPTTLPDETLRLPLLRAMQGAATVRMLGSGSVELAAVAAGRLGASVQADSLPGTGCPAPIWCAPPVARPRCSRSAGTAGTWPGRGRSSTSWARCCAGSDTRPPPRVTPSDGRSHLIN